MRRRLPGHLASLAALLRSMPTAHGQGYQALAHLWMDEISEASVARNYKNQCPTTSLSPGDNGRAFRRSGAGLFALVQRLVVFPDVPVSPVE